MKSPLKSLKTTRIELLVQVLCLVIYFGVLALDGIAVYTEVEVDDIYVELSEGVGEMLIE